MRTPMVLVVLAVVTGLAWAQEDPYEALSASPQAWRVKAGWADLGDWNGDFTAALEYNLPKWDFTAGWAKATGHLVGQTGSFNFGGDYYYLEGDYTYRPRGNPLSYIGLGVGWYRMDGNFTSVGSNSPQSGHDDCMGANVVVGTESSDRRWFGELRWVLATKHWDWDSDGLRAYIGYRF